MSVNRLFHLLNETNHSCPDFKGQNYRASFHTRSSAKGPRKKTYKAHLDGEGPRKGEHAVVKVFRQAPGTESMCDLEISKHLLARKFARKFNKMVTESTDKINFTLPLKSTVDRFGMGTYLVRHSRHMDKQEWVLIEENLVHDTECKFQVFLKKNGDRPRKDPSSLDAFLHFSYFESGQKFVMCGFQGIHTEQGGYKLSTPCLHSAERRWGLPDKGRSGTKAVFDRHKCNNLCYSWPKPSDHLAPGDAEVMSSENDTEEGEAASTDDDEEEATRVESSLAFSVRSTPVSRGGSVVRESDAGDDGAGDAVDDAGAGHDDDAGDNDDAGDAGDDADAGEADDAGAAGDDDNDDDADAGNAGDADDGNGGDAVQADENDTSDECAASTVDDGGDSAAEGQGLGADPENGKDDDSLEGGENLADELLQQGTAA